MVSANARPFVTVTNPPTIQMTNARLRGQLFITYSGIKLRLILSNARGFESNYKVTSEYAGVTRIQRQIIYYYPSLVWDTSTGR